MKITQDAGRDLLLNIRTKHPPRYVTTVAFQKCLSRPGGAPVPGAGGSHGLCSLRRFEATRRAQRATPWDSCAAETHPGKEHSAKEPRGGVNPPICHLEGAFQPPDTCAHLGHGLVPQGSSPLQKHAFP